MTFKPSHKPAGTPDGGQFTSHPHKEPDLSLTSSPEDRQAFEARVQATFERGVEARRKIAERDRLRAHNPPAQDEPPVVYVPATAPPVRKGWFSRAMSAIESFGTSVEIGHQQDMDEIASLSREKRIARARLRSGD